MGAETVRIKFAEATGTMILTVHDPDIVLTALARELPAYPADPPVGVLLYDPNFHVTRVGQDPAMLLGAQKGHARVSGIFFRKP